MQDKCRVAVDKGVVLIGTMDETGTLPESTFWASWERPLRNSNSNSKSNSPYSNGEAQSLPAGTRALVGRNPVVSPADIRILEAADPEGLADELKALTNVLVFPKVGKRPEPCKMSGGDLDGDIFFVIWDETLLPPREAPAMDYRCSLQACDLAGLFSIL
jgi:RNA-dependent RNA polymerase